MGLKSIELLDEKDWPTVKEYGLTCAMANGPGQIPVGWNRKENHERLIKRSKDLLYVNLLDVECGQLQSRISCKYPWVERSVY